MKPRGRATDNPFVPMKLSTPALARLIGHLGFLILLALSVVLARERVLLVDSAAQLFELIQRGTFVIYDHRYTMAVTQLLPLAGIKLGLPLPVLVVLYSMAAPLMAYLAFLLLTYCVKDIPLALLLLFPMLCIRHTFFHGISETFSLMVYATLLLALLRHRRNTPLHAAGIVLCTLACVFMHPVGMFFVLFLLGYHVVDTIASRTGRIVSLQAIVMTVTLVAAVIVKAQLPSGHDAGYMPSVADVLYRLTHPSELQVVRHLFESVADFYLYPLALYVVVLIWHIRRRQWLRMGWGLAFNVGFFLLTAVVYHADTSHICVERAWLPLIFFAGVPFVCEYRGRRPQSTLLVFAALLLLAYGKIVDSSKHYRQRLNELQTIVERGRREGHRKLVAESPTVDSHFRVHSWATAFETLMLSSMQSPDSTATLYLDELPCDPSNPDYQRTDAYLAVPWNRLWRYSTLDPRYFRLPLQPYHVLD